MMTHQKPKPSNLSHSTPPPPTKLYKKIEIWGMYLNCKLEWNCLVSLQVNDMDVANILEAMGIFLHFCLLGLPWCKKIDEGCDRGEDPEGAVKTLQGIEGDEGPEARESGEDSRRWYC